MEVAGQGWAFICTGADFYCDFCCKYEYCMGESYVNIESSDFQKSFGPEGR